MANLRFLGETARFCDRIGVDFRSWTGGSFPRPIDQVTGDERHLVTHLFRADCATWQAYCKAPVPKDVRETLWNRARGDAHATFRKD